MHYSLIIKTTASVHFTTVHANLIEQTTSSIELVVLKRRIIVVIRKGSRCLLLHQLEQHRWILLSKETYRTLAQPADPCGNHFGDMIWKIPNPTLIYQYISRYLWLDGCNNEIDLQIRSAGSKVIHHEICRFPKNWFDIAINALFPSYWF